MNTLPSNATEVCHYGQVVGYFWPVNSVFRAVGEWNKPLGIYASMQEAHAAILKSAKDV